ncbi:hypothetical protein ACFSQ7_50415 [Paenibacillus rhizoplanae]
MAVQLLFDKEQYYNARAHKFKTNRYILEVLAQEGSIDFLAVGVDDANTQGVQINEIHYMEAGINEWLGGTHGQKSGPGRHSPGCRRTGTVLTGADGESALPERGYHQVHC